MYSKKSTRPHVSWSSEILSSTSKTMKEGKNVDTAILSVCVIGEVQIICVYAETSLKNGSWYPNCHSASL